MKIQSPRFIFLVIVFSFFYSINSNAQQLGLSRRNSYYTYIYKITSQQAQQLYNGYYAELKPDFFVHLTDSFPSDSIFDKKLPDGHYLFVTAVEEHLKTELKSFTSTDINILQNGKALSIQVYDKKTGKIITDAKLTLKDKTLKYNPQSKTFVIKTNKQGLLRVETRNDTAFFRIERNTYYSTYPTIVRIGKKLIYSFPLKYITRFVRNTYYRIAYGESPDEDRMKHFKGYIAFNKPKYLPDNDTVKLKILLATKKGKLYNKPVRISISEDYSGKYEKKISLTPVSPGAYVYELPLNDSLDLGEYSVRVYHKKKNKYFLSNHFQIEDYQLDDITYNVRPEKKEYHKGEPVNLFLSGKDINGFNVLGGKADVKISSGYISKYIGNEVFVPNVLWKKTVNLDVVGETKVTIPDTIFPEINMNVDVNVVFRNANNELHEKWESFDYFAQNDWIYVELIDDTIYARINNSSKHGEEILYKETGDEKITEEITYPFKEKLNPNIYSYCFFTENADYCFVPDEEEESNFSCSAYHQNDTVIIRFNNPRKLDIHYTILKNRKQVYEEGTTQTLNRKIVDHTNASYFVKCAYVWAGKIKHEDVDIYKYDKLLNVSIKQPSDVYPGQKTAIKIKVTDKKQNPVKNANLTAVSVNGKFKKKNFPALPYFGKRKKTSPYYPPFSKENVEYEKYVSLNTYWQSRMHLDTIAYYQFIYPEKMTLLYDTIPEIENAQFAPFLYENGEQKPVFLIYLDDKLIYYFEADNNTMYSFIGKEGYHKIRIRSYRKEYILDSVLLKNGQKLNLSINVDNVPDGIKVIEKPAEFTPQEVATIKNATLLLKRNFNPYHCFLWQNDNPIKFHSGEKDIYKITPVEQDSIYFVGDTFKTGFIFEPGYEYTIEKDLIKKLSPKKEYINSKVSFFYTKSFSDVKYPAQLITRYKEKPLLDMLIDPNPYRYNKSSTELMLDYTGDSSIYIIRLSSLDTSISPRYFYGNTKQIYDVAEGIYQLLLITSNNTYMLKDSIKIKSNGTNYIRFGDTNLKISKNIEFTDSHTIKSVPNEDNNIKYGKSILIGKITDAKDKEPIPFANISIMKNKQVIIGGMTDISGFYKISHIPVGVYDIKASYMGYSTLVYSNVYLAAKRNTFLNFKLSPNSNLLQCVQIVNYRQPLMAEDEMRPITSEEIQKMACRSAGEPSMVCGVTANLNNLEDVYLQLNDDKEKDEESLQPHQSRSSIRKNFSDYAYWQANLLTDENGEASFTTTFPDNITRWDGYVIAVGNRQSGMGFSQTKSYKKLLAQVSTPRFLIVGDQTTAFGKIANYSLQPKHIQTSFSINKKLIFSHTIDVNNSYIDSLPVTAQTTDSIELLYKLKQDNGYFDGEERKIPVFRMGSNETKGSFDVLDKDTVLHFHFDKNKTVKIVAQNNVLSVLEDEIKYLDEYPYYCMEQTSSKLTALLLQQQIQTNIFQKRITKQKIKKLLKILQSGQNDNGGWGWWQTSPTNVWMTAYVLQTLLYAQQFDYHSKSIEKAIDYIKWKLDVLKGDDLLYNLLVLSEAGEGFAYVGLLKKIENRPLSLYQKLALTRIKQLTKQKYSIDDILKLVKQTYRGNYYWKSDSLDFSFYNTSNNLTLLAYRIIEAKDSLHPALKKIRNYFLETKENNWRNTIDKSQIIKTLLPAIVADKEPMNDKAKLKIVETGKEITQFPYTESLPKGSSDLSIEYTGTSTLYLSTYQELWNPRPTQTDSLFKITTWFEQDGQKTDTLKVGIPAEMRVQVEVKRKGKYFMLEVPIPAGCSYGHHETAYSYSRNHREYYKHKTNLYFEQLDAGTYTYTIRLEPRFPGVYNLNPTKMELMYNPVLYGRNAMKKVVIK